MSFQHDTFQQNAFQVELPGVGQGPFNGGDQPNPVLRVSFFATCLALSACFGTPNTLPLQRYQPREAVVTRAPPRVVQQPFDAPNVLITIPVVVVAPPFDQTDWPNPLPKPRTVQPEPPPNLLTETLFEPFGEGAAYWPSYFAKPRTVQPEPPPNLTRQIQPPFEQTDWPNPLPKPRTVQPDPIPNLSAIGFAPNPIPKYVSDFPNPVLRTRTVQPEIPPNITITVPTVVAAPFVQSDYPNPVLRTRTVQPEPPPNRTGTNLPPFNQDDWPNPAPKPRTVWKDTASAPPMFTPNPIPFNQDDWPNPVLRTRTVQPEIPVDLIALQAAPAVIVYQARGPLYRWIAPIPLTKTDIPPNILLNIYYFAGQPPFKQTEWFTPRRRFDWLSQTFDVLRYDDDHIPFSQDQWPNPIRRVYKADLQDYINHPALYTRDVVTRVPATVPILRKRTVQPEIPINIRPLTGPLQPTFKQLNWPNPNLRTRTVQPEIPRNLALSLTPPRPPFNLTVQPNPTLRLQGYWVFQFDRLNLALQTTGWEDINDGQTPGWNATGDPCTVDSTIGTADTTLYTADMDCSATWGPIDDSDTPGWVPIVDTQAPAWTPVDDSDTPGWTPVVTDPGGSSSS